MSEIDTSELPERHLILVEITEELKNIILSRFKIVDLEILDRLIKGTKIDLLKGCWLRNDWSSYNNIKIGSKLEGIHRISYRLATGNINYNMILHKCDRKGCWNPEHLYNGNDSSNKRDRELRKLADKAAAIDRKIQCR